MAALGTEPDSVELPVSAEDGLPQDSLRDQLRLVSTREGSSVFFDPTSLAILTDGVHESTCSAQARAVLAALPDVADDCSQQLPPPPDAANLTRPRLQRLTLNISNCCNLACRYCYAHGGDYAMPQALMSGHRAAELVGEALRLWDIDALMFFGGEPSLNPDAIAEACLLVTELHRAGLIANLPRFAAISNLAGQGETFDAFLGLCKLLNIHITASIDGPPQVHDANRVDRTGNGSYARVRDNFARARDLGLSLSIECTYSDQHLAQGISVIELMRFFDQEFGLQQTHIAPVMQQGCKGEKAAELCAQYCDAIQFTLETLSSGHMLSFSLGQRILLALARRQPIAQYCPAGQAELTIGPDGMVYPCFMFVGAKEFELGTMDAERWPADKGSKVLCEIEASGKANHPLCRDCWARGLCSGCIGGDYYATGSLSSKPSCALTRSMAAEAIVRLAEMGQGKRLGYYGHAHRLRAFQ
ncbi:MAG: radical SAM protein [Chloroflexi bacterium]|nr:radical SAM protein [Chloroflexota bacterium]